MAREKDFQSAFDIIGPVMMGPSSSHTAGAVKLVMQEEQYCKANQKISKFITMNLSQKHI